MDTGRVGACHKLENKRRKFLIVINDVVKNKYDVYSEYLDHANIEADHNFEKSKMFVRRALVRQKVLQQCMKMRRQRNDDSRNMFGRYGGKSIESFGRDIESFISYNHPKMRRKRYLQKLLKESLERGVILKPEVVENRVASWMERSYTKFKLKQAKREKTNLEPIKESKSRESIKEKRTKPSDRLSQNPRLPVLGKSFYTGSTEPEPEDDHASPDVDIIQISEKVKKVKIDDTSDEENHDRKFNKHRAKLVLPPINPSKAMVTT